MERLNKVIAQSGICSRRKADELILQGKVKINDIVVKELGVSVSSKDIVTVDGIELTKEDKKYYCLYKPRGVISSVSDEKDRRTVISILPETLKKERLFPVGRLDYDTNGVIILTNDGEFMNACVGPSSGVEKEYLARVKGIVKKEELEVFYKGMKINGEKLLPCRYNLESVDNKNESSLVRVITTEGKYHQIKEMFKTIGHEVKRLKRVRFGCVTLDGLKEGEICPLTIHEIKTFYFLSKENKNIRKRGK